MDLIGTSILCLIFINFLAKDMLKSLIICILE